MKKILNISALLILVNICIACNNNVDYMNRKDYAKLRADQGVDSFIPTKFDGRKIREYGGVVIKNAEDEDNSSDINEEDHHYVAFKREKSRVFAETLLFRSDNERKTFVDQTFFDFGVDKKKKTLSLNLTLKY